MDNRRTLILLNILIGVLFPILLLFFSFIESRELRDFILTQETRSRGLFAASQLSLSGENGEDFLSSASSVLAPFENSWDMVFYLCGENGNLLYFTDQSLFAEKSVNIADLYGSAFFEELRRSRDRVEGVLLRKSGGVAFWGLYLPEKHEYFLATYRTAALTVRVRRQFWESLLKMVFPVFICVAFVLFILPETLSGME